MKWGPRQAALALVLAVLWAAAGCAYPNRGDMLERFSATLGTNAPNEAYDPPRMRMGSMPFDAWYSPFEPVAVDGLGEHSYAVGWFDARWGETSRGIVYTRRGGFLDVSHMRNAADLTWWIYKHVLRGYVDGSERLRFVAAEPEVYIVRLHGLAAWRGGDGRPAPVQARRAAAAVAGRLATLMTSWHEVLTWYGYKGMGVIPEGPSAFSYDDAASNRAGVAVALKVLAPPQAASNPRAGGESDGDQSADATGHRGEGGPAMDVTQYDAAVTRELARYLRRLGAVDPARTTRRMREVEGKWWSGEVPTRRVFDLGLAGRPVTAMVVAPDVQPVTWNWPRDQTVAGRRVSRLYDVWIIMKTMEAGAIDRALGIKHRRPLHPRTDFPRLHAALMENQ